MVPAVLHIELAAVVVVACFVAPGSRFVDLRAEVDPRVVKFEVRAGSLSATVALVACFDCYFDLPFCDPFSMCRIEICLSLARRFGFPKTPERRHQGRKSKDGAPATLAILEQEQSQNISCQL